MPLEQQGVKCLAQGHIGVLQWIPNPDLSKAYVISTTPSSPLSTKNTVSSYKSA